MIFAYALYIPVLSLVDFPVHFNLSLSINGLIYVLIRLVWVICNKEASSWELRFLVSQSLTIQDSITALFPGLLNVSFNISWVSINISLSSFKRLNISFNIFGSNFKGF